MSASLIRKIKFLEAGRSEARWVSDQLPQPLVDDYVMSDLHSVAEHIAEGARSRPDERPVDVLLAHKWRHGRRPIALLPVEDRILYRGVIGSMFDNLPVLNREDEDFARFRNAPTEEEWVTHVVSTDIANFYSSIPIDSLSRLTLHRVGDHESVEWLQKFWLYVSGRAIGIPQVNESSDLVAEIYAEELERRVATRGVRTFRYADDFRIVAGSRKAAVEAIEIFDEEAREVGLFVNERKTFLQTIESYSVHLKGIKDPTDVIEEARQNLQGINMYTFEPMEPDEAVVFQDAARSMLDSWNDDLYKDLGIQEQLEAAKLARKALKILTAISDDSAPMGIFESMLDLDPQNTPAIAQYLRGLITRDPSKVVSVLDKIIDRVALSKWQRYWVLHILEAGRVAELSEKSRGWVKAQTASSQAEVLRTYACWVLAKNWSLDFAHWESAAAGGVTRLGSPNMSAAAAHCFGRSPGDRMKLVPGTYIDRAMFDWSVQEQQNFTDPF